MPENKYLQNAIPKIYKAQTIDVMAFTFIDTYKFIMPGANLKEIVKAFMKRYKINEDLLSEDSILQSYYRTLKLITDGEKSKD